MKRTLYFVYGSLCHAMFLAVFLYMVGFLANSFVPKSIDGPASPGGPGVPAALIDLGLLVLFGIQHSVMARPTFKRWWTRIVPAPIERSTYVLASNLVLVLLLWQWRPLPGVLWDVRGTVAEPVLWSLFGFGWLLIVFASLLIDHFDLFGTRQVWMHLCGKAYTPPAFRAPALYKAVRHPLYVGWLLAFWVTPVMTLGHLLFSLGNTAYILIAIRLEERNLAQVHPEYAAYRRRVPMLVPFGKAGSSARAPERVEGTAS